MKDIIKRLEQYGINFTVNNTPSKKELERINNLILSRELKIKEMVAEYKLKGKTGV